LRPPIRKFSHGTSRTMDLKSICSSTTADHPVGMPAFGHLGHEKSLEARHDVQGIEKTALVRAGS
jgi:hypothetical protein